jgi:hypothetical protein
MRPLITVAFAAILPPIGLTLNGYFSTSHQRPFLRVDGLKSLQMELKTP